MASSSSCGLIGAPVSDHSTAYEVFLSFRGEDTRHSFTDHLFQALVRAGLHTFRDTDEIDRGRELKPDIERAIKQSRAFIVVLSENYVNSRWCLDELVLIYVRNQSGSYAIQGSKWTQDNVNRWKKALTHIANLTGIVVSGSETDSIAKVVDTINCELDLKLVSTPPHLTGIETRAEIINPWLKDEQSSYDVLAICGMGGSGCKLELLNDYESLELVSSHAFGSKFPMEGFEDLALVLAKYCEGNLLALKVLGSSLFVSIEDPWSKDDVVTILEDDCYAKFGIMTLINRCLLTIAPGKKFEMHQLLQDMGRKMISEESKDPAKRSRVWCSDEAYHLLREGDGSKVIEGLALKTGKLKEGTKVI
ncbi:toll/interleukin-1 receptor (TIR) domain-containing protein [Artemisia annua]|uniref:Toll/interleukin-1 receptor (TIR) domain-containing protein n=1 Tax=Artemisia annua TaxID=35608 RepID=A0A2U1NZ96_ARTAN|nr:toll/interleukin-1 receptor (TIR) domain-containing protein [Artemisia annua]